ncbi:putative DNA-directed RNA polymerase III subunit RPC7-like isoform X2 [Apostichopus japonicus]|uniref:Putative DNA-directed RNA polymerase III subunit RPC7-like isoform X2 n=1 Tax=Stichopus japonicus TaxID=307972 RepID=A0A2G8LMZ8_STIJA|nr:putative DNA-directed RNA polymerase III subunit RPC7-like isoform X2 [Apostichopus japonicus]
MAGRGRGRGSAFSYTAEVLGLGRGADAIPASVLQPPPPFPPLQFKPVPLASGESYEYMLLLKQEFRGSMRDSPFYIKPLDKKKDIQRYSDKYQSQTSDDQWIPNWKNLPKELNYLQKTRRPSKRRDVKPNVTAKSDGKEIVKTLENLEKKEEESQGDQKKAAEGKGEDSGTDEEDIVYSEEEEVEGDDYQVSYFDPGEDYLDEDNGADEGPTY